MRTARIAFWTSLAIGACVLTSCANVKVRKVPTPTQYSVWTDEMQRKADSMEGFRFYLPRPFLNVFESFPVRTDIYIADGHVSPDGKYVIIESVRKESGLNDYLAGVKKDTVIPSDSLTLPSEDNLNRAERILGAQSGAFENLAKAITNVPTVVGTGGTDTGKSKTSNATPTPTTGINKRDVRNDNGAFAYQPKRNPSARSYRA